MRKKIIRDFYATWNAANPTYSVLHNCDRRIKKDYSTTRPDFPAIVT